LDCPNFFLLCDTAQTVEPFQDERIRGATRRAPAMPEYEAQDALEVANTFGPGEQRGVLLRMAQVWLRLAHECSGATWPFSRPGVSEQPAMQQQQRVQPDDDEKA